MVTEIDEWPSRSCTTIFQKHRFTTLAQFSEPM
jgi:hypothetical protein